MKNEKLSFSHFRRALLEWWDSNKRDFSWRRTSDPYKILIAEMLLRKTTAQQVEGQYNKFLEKYPSIRSLSRANKITLVNLLKPLGMEYIRAEVLKRFAKSILNENNGEIPLKIENLLKIPGVGMYASCAVLSCAYRKKVPMVDANFIRLIGRIFNLRSTKARARNDKVIWEFARNLVPSRKSKEFNLAVLDYAALICKSRNPSCDICVFRNYCLYNKMKCRTLNVSVQ